MGIYDTPQKDMGRLGMRVARRGWWSTPASTQGMDQEPAVAFMKDNTTLTDANIDAEVIAHLQSRQALAHKLGELKIGELRAWARRTRRSLTCGASMTRCWPGLVRSTRSSADRRLDRGGRQRS
jgi:uncharacterized protein (DUF885 family)